MKGIRIDVDFQTGYRAGAIDPKDLNLPCNPQWQDTEAGVEIRLVVNGEVDQYRDVSGVEVLEDEAAIDEAVAALPCNCAAPSWAIANEAIMMESIRQKDIDLTDISCDCAGSDLAKRLRDKGALGIASVKIAIPLPASVLARKWKAKD